jgi:alcohol sulfotransferase
MMSEMRLSSVRSAARWGRRKMLDLRLAIKAAEVDAFLVSYPKSGRTWLRFLLSCYLADLYHLPVETDLKTTFQVLPNFDLDPERGLPAFIGDRSSPPCPLIAVSHRQFDRRLFARTRVVMLVRDPRDVCVSAYFHQTRHKHRFAGTLHEFIGDPQFGIGSIIDYHNGWAAGLYPGVALIISYEELSRDPQEAVLRILHYLGIPADEGLIDRAIERAAFDRMKQDEKRTQIPGHTYDPTDAESSRVRKGKVGGFGEYLDTEQQLRISSMLRNGLSQEAAALIEHSGYAG